MANPFYTATGNPAFHADGLSANIRTEYRLVEAGFDLLPRFTSTGVFSTIFTQQGNHTFALPTLDGTLALVSNVTTETTRATAAEGANTTAIAVEATRAAAAETANTAAITAETTRATAAEAQFQNNAGRNLFHNSMWRVRQRGDGPFVGTGYTADRWTVLNANGTVNVTFGTFADLTRTQIGDEAARTFMAANVAGTNGAGDFIMFAQFIEGVSRISGKTVTISFWAYTGAVGLKIGVGLRQSFGTGGSPSAIVDVTGQSVTTTNIPARYSVTFAVPSTDGKTFGTTANTTYTRVAFAFSSGITSASILGTPGVQTGTFVMWGLQCELGSARTPLEKIDPQIELAQCQRFYQIGQCVISGYGLTAVSIGQTVSLPVTMLDTPTIATSAAATVNVSSFTATALASGAIWFHGTVTVTGSWQIDTNTFTATAGGY